MARNPKNAALISLLAEHLQLFEALGHRVDRRLIGDQDRPSVEIVPGLIWARDNNETIRLPVVDDLARHFRGLRRLDGHYFAVFAVDGTYSWSRFDKGQGATVPLGEDNTVKVWPASINCTTSDDGASLLPIDVPMDVVIAWRYVGGRKVSGKALPLDLEGSIAKGWFRRLDDPTHTLVEGCTLFPVRNLRGRSGRVVIEGQAFHQSGKRIMCPLAVNWTNQGDYLLSERDGMFFAVPLAQINTPEAVTAIAESEEQTELGPDEYVCGICRGNVWNDLEKYGVRRDMSVAEIRKLQRTMQNAKHPDKLQARLAKVLSADTLESVLATASLQFYPADAAFTRALEIRAKELAPPAEIELETGTEMPAQP